MRLYTWHQQLVSISCESLFIYLFISPSHDFQHKVRVSEWMNEWTDGRAKERGNEWMDGRASAGGREGMNEWRNERTNERTSERERANERTEQVSEWVREGGRERVSEWVSDWFRECVNEFIGGYKVDFSKFKRGSTFNYCTAIQTNKDGQNMFWLESV